MKFFEILTRTFTWWNGQTWGTYFYTRRNGELVGEDHLGNLYYRATGPVLDPSNGPERRWVIYNGEVEASRVPPGWRGWLTHTHDVPPPLQTHVSREWEKPHLANLTGTPEAYRPPGSTLECGERPAATGDYVAWAPDGSSDHDVRQPNQHPGTHGVGLKQPQHG